MANKERPKKIESKLTKVIVEDLMTQITDNLEPNPVIETQIVEVIKEVFVDRILEVPAKKVKGWRLYKALKDAHYPQGGQGDWWEDPDGTEKVYVPRPEELYGHFLGDPAQWKALRDELARAWLEISSK